MEKRKPPKKQEHRQKKRQFWAEKVEAFEASGLSQDEFCIRESISFTSFKYWLYQFRQQQAILIENSSRSHKHLHLNKRPKSEKITWDENIGAEDFIAAQVSSDSVPKPLGGNTTKQNNVASLPCMRIHLPNGTLIELPI